MAYKRFEKDGTYTVTDSLEHAKSGVRYERHFEHGERIVNKGVELKKDIAGESLTNEMFMSTVTRSADKKRAEYQKKYKRFVTLYNQGHTLEEIALAMDLSVHTLNGARYRVRLLNSQK